MKNSRMVEWLTIIGLLVLIIIRIAVGASAQTMQWISMVNFAGLILAVVNLYGQVYKECNKEIRGGFFLVFVVLVVALLLMLTNVWKPSSMINDIVLLITLLISLTSRLYCSILVTKKKGG